MDNFSISLFFSPLFFLLHYLIHHLTKHVVNLLEATMVVGRTNHLSMQRFSQCLVDRATRMHELKPHIDIETTCLLPSSPHSSTLCPPRGSFRILTYVTLHFFRSSTCVGLILQEILSRFFDVDLFRFFFSHHTSHSHN